MWLNILIALCVGILGYGLTVYFNHNDAPNIIVQDEAGGSAQVAINQPAPDFSFTALDEKAHKLSDFKGKKIILNFWASWCAPCIKEFPALLGLSESHAEDTVLIAISSDYEEAAMLRFLDKMKAGGFDLQRPNIFIALDNDSSITAGLFKTYQLPETFIIDSNQTLRHKLIGADWDEKDVSTLLDTLP